MGNFKYYESDKIRYEILYFNHIDMCICIFFLKHKLSIYLSDFVKGHYNSCSSKLLNDLRLLNEVFLSFLETNGVYYTLTLRTLETSKNYREITGVNTKGKLKV